MSVFRFGRASQTALPTLTVFVDPGTIKPWRTISQSMNLIMRRANGMIQIQFFPGSINNTSGNSVVGSPSPRHIIGSSVSEWDQEGGGTLGGFGYFQRGRVKGPGFLTNHHIAQHASPAQPREAKKGEIGRNVQIKNIPIIQYPARANLAAKIQDIDLTEIPVAKALKQSTQEKIDRHHVAGTGVPIKLTERLNFGSPKLWDENV